MNFLELVQKEVDESRAKYGDTKSAHEGLGLLWEEFNEVSAEIFKKKHDHALMVKELVQVAAVCYKIATDVCGLETEKVE